MHELSIAMSIIDVASEEAQRRSARVVAVHLRLGPLSGVVKEALLSAWELAAENSPLAGSKLIITEEPVEIDCARCGGPRPVESIQRMCCSRCGTPSATVVRGRVLEVTALEICDEQPTPTG